ncbi:MAG: carbon-nitrogen hydrolase family protein [Myxococcales bacterium]|nr:carbon-nitrogen hydrolase family protein [Myxococcales bacterium]
MRIAAVQFKARKGDWAASLDAARPLVRDATEGADLVVLPEMALTGYVFDSREAAAAVAESADGPTYAALAPLAAAAGCWLVAGFPERDGDRLFNSALVIAPDGALAFTYRKTLLYDADEVWATPGDSGYRVFETGAGTFAVGICMDLNDDAFLDWCDVAAPRAIAFPTNWIDEGLDIWRYWAGRAAPTGAAIIAADTWGSEGTTQFWGRSAIIDSPSAKGEPCILHAAAGPTGDAVIRATLPWRERG